MFQSLLVRHVAEFAPTTPHAERNNANAAVDRRRRRSQDESLYASELDVVTSDETVSIPIAATKTVAARTTIYCATSSDCDVDAESSNSFIHREISLLPRAYDVGGGGVGGGQTARELKA